MTGRAPVESAGYPPLVDLFLGMVSWLRRQAATIREAAVEGGQSAAGQADPNMVELFLGVVALERTLERHLSALDPAAAVPAARAALPEDPLR